MGMSDWLLQGCLVAACFLVAFGVVRLVRAIRRERQRRAFADYQAALLICNAKREVSASRFRAARASEDCQ